MRKDSILQQYYLKKLPKYQDKGEVKKLFPGWDSQLSNIPASRPPELKQSKTSIPKDKNYGQKVDPYEKIIAKDTEARQAERNKDLAKRAAISAGIAGAIVTGGMAAPYVMPALNAPLVAAIPGSSLANIGASYFAADALANRFPQVPGQISRGEYLDAGVNALTGAFDLAGANMISPLAKGVKSVISETGRALGTETGLLSNTYKINPRAIKENPEMFLYRVRPVGQNIDMNMAAQMRAKEAAGEPLTWYQKNLLNPQTNPQLLAREKYYGQWFEKNPSRLDFYINPGTRNFADDEAIEILRTRLPKAEAAKLNVSQFPDAKVLSASPETEFILPKNMISSAERFPESSWQQLIQEDKAFNKPHWLKGFNKTVEVPKPRFISSEPQIISQSSGMDAVNAKVPGYNAHLFQHGENVVGKELPESLKLTIREEPWQLGFQPGLHIKSTMTGSPLEKQLSKTGQIDINNIRAYIGKADVGSQDKYIIDKVLNEKFAGQKKIDYNAFRSAVSNELIPLNMNEVPDFEHANWGLNRLGYTGPKTKNVISAIKATEENIASLEKKIKELDLLKDNVDGGNLYRYYENELAEAKNKLLENQKLLENVPLKNKTFTFSNAEKFGRGDTKHFMDPATLGHTRTLVSREEPHVSHILESQSDFYQNEGKTVLEKLKGLKENNTDVFAKRMGAADRQLKNLSDDKKLLEDLEYRYKNNLPDANGDPVHESTINQLKYHIKTNEEMLNLRKAELQNWEQKLHLGKSHQERFLQENMKNAVQNGQTTMRYPTSETAAKIQGYNKQSDIGSLLSTQTDVSTLPNDLQVLVKNVRNASKDSYDAAYKNLEDYLKNNNLNFYSKEHSTILKKYSDAPKMIKKTIGVEPKLVTDPKGNTWYEFDIPEKYLTGEEEIRAFKKGGLIKDNRGQWAHPGKITEIQGDTMATHGYGDIPLYVIPDVGEPRVVEANTGTHTFPGATKFIEIPMMQKGGTLPPIYTDDPRKVKAYRDSLAAYDLTQNAINFIKNKDINTEEEFYKVRDTPPSDVPLSYKNILPTEWKFVSPRSMKTPLHSHPFMIAGYKKPVQPYILEESKLAPSKFVPEARQESMSLPFMPTERGSINLPDIKKLPYVVEYTDPRTHEPMEQRFLNAQEADPFFQSVQSGSGTRGYYEHKAYGGPLVEYYKGKMNHGEMFKNGGPVSLNGIIKQNREDRDNNTYSGGISKYSKGGQANKYYYNKGYGVPHFAWGGPTYVNKYGYLVDKKAGGGEWHHGYYDEYGGDISVPQLPDLQGPLLQYYYSKGGKR